MSVIYIMGYGRSGSTLLDIVFSNSKNTICCGELQNIIEYLLLDSHKLNRENNIEILKFWDDIKDQLRQKYTNDELNEILKEQNHKYLLKNPIKNILTKLQTSKSNLFIDFNITLFRLLKNKLPGKNLLDSSKNPIRYQYIQRFIDPNIHCLLLVKQVSGVANSLKKAWNKNPVNGVPFKLPSVSGHVTAIKWLYTNIFSYYMLSKQKNWIYIEYEDLCKYKNAILHILSLKKSLSDYEDIKDLSIYYNQAYSFAGNRLRLSKEVSVKYSKPKTNYLNKLEITTCRIVQYIWDTIKPDSNKWK